MSLKESDVTSAFSSLLSHVKNQVRNNVVAACKRKLVVDLDDKNISQLCNLIDSSVDQAISSGALGAEARGLVKKSKGWCNMPGGIKHLVECHCILPQFKKRESIFEVEEGKFLAPKFN